MCYHTSVLHDGVGGRPVATCKKRWAGLCVCRLVTYCVYHSRYELRWQVRRVVVSVLEMPVRDPTSDDEYMTLGQAAKIAGYKSQSTLQIAAREGRLRSILLCLPVQLIILVLLEEQ